MGSMNKHKSLVYIVVVLVLSFASVSVFFTVIHAAPLQADDPWENMGLYGGPTESVAFDPSLNRFYLVTCSYPGFYYSDDNGDTWMTTEAGFFCGTKVVLGSDGALYAHFGNELMRSDDQGNTWESITAGQGLSGYDIPDFDLAENDSNHILVTRMGDTDEANRIYSTIDGGQTWMTATISLSNTAPFVGVIFDPSDNNNQTAYAVDSRMWENFNSPSHIFQSLDGGVSFTTVFTAPVGEQFFSVGANISGTLYAGTNQNLYRSTDGLQWDSVLSTTNRSVNFIAFSPVNPRIVYIDGYTSTDDGQNWIQMGMYLFLGQSSIDPNLMFTGYPGGLKRSLDGGSTWAIANNGINGVIVLGAISDPRDSQIFYVGSESGMGRSFDGGETWEFPLAGINSSVFAFDFDPDDSSVFYGATWGGLYKFSEYGSVWTKVNVGQGDYNEPLEFFDMAVDPSNGDILYLAGSGYDPDLAGPVGGLYLSDDRGTTWMTSTLNGDPVNAVVAAETISGSVIYAGVGDYAGYSGIGGGVFKSTDQGLSWQQAGLSDKVISTLAVDPTNSEILFAGSFGEDFPPGEAHPVYRSQDGGNSWAQLSFDGCPDIRAIAIDPNMPETVYVAGCENLYKSTDGGESWTDYYDGQAVIYDIYVPVSPPSSVEDLSAEISANQIDLSWSNPTDIDFVGTQIRFLTDTFPTAHMIGISLTNQMNLPGSTDNFTHTNILTSETYYYAAFAYDSDGNFAKPTWISATIPISSLKATILSVTTPASDISSQVFIATSQGLYRRVDTNEVYSVYLPVSFKE